MKKLITFSLTPLLFSFISIVAAAQTQSPLTANEMLAICTDQTQQESLICNAYMKGFLDGMINGSTLATWNPPQNQVITYATVKNSFIKLLKTYPVLGNTDLGSVVSYALQAEGLVTMRQGTKSLSTLPLAR